MAKKCARTFSIVVEKGKKSILEVRHLLPDALPRSVRPRGRDDAVLTAWAPPERPPVRPLVALPRQKPTVILTQTSWRARSRGSVAQPGRRRRSIRAALLAAILAGCGWVGREPRRAEQALGTLPSAAALVSV